MIVGILVESGADERRVALVPASVTALSKAGVEVMIQRGAGLRAGFPDAHYEAKGVLVGADEAGVVAAADAIACVRPPSTRLRPGQLVVGMLDPFVATASVQRLADAGVTAFALELLPRISRAQAMDVLSSMAMIAGYKAVLLAAVELGKMFPMNITAAGTLAPAKVLVLGAGVAGLQAIATARRLGAVVTGYDIRPAVREQVESLGAAFLEIELEAAGAEDAGGYAREMDAAFYDEQRRLIAAAVAEHDIVISTAAIPGKRAPVLITEEMVRGMVATSVIVDLAAESGGNCELTRPGETIDAHGIKIMGPVGLPSSVPHHASQMYSKNVATFVAHLMQDGAVLLQRDDEIIRDTMVTHGGKVVNERVLRETATTVSEEATAAAETTVADERKGS